MRVDLSMVVFDNLDEVNILIDVLKSLLLSGSLVQKQQDTISLILICLTVVRNYKMQQFIPDVNISVPFEKRRFIK